MTPGSDQTRPSLTPSRGPWLLLLLTIPLAIVGWVFLLIVISLFWCGLDVDSGCPGPSSSGADVVVLSVGASVVGGGLWFGAIAGPPWFRPLGTRLGIAAVVGVVMAALLLVLGTRGFAGV